MTPRQLAAHLNDADLPSYHREVDPEVPLDRWIGYAVKVLRDAGVETYESCQGGPGHSFKEPTIRFHGEQGEGFRAVSVALNHGLPVFSVRRAWGVRGGELHGPHWEMTFHPLSKLASRQREAERSGVMK